MPTIYIYLHHQGFDFYITNYLLSEEECYCSYCEDSDELLGCYSDQAQLQQEVDRLLERGIQYYSKCPELDVWIDTSAYSPECIIPDDEEEDVDFVFNVEGLDI